MTYLVAQNILMVKMTPDGKLYPKQKIHNGADSTLVS